MYKQEGTKVAIIGAGAVGSTTAFAIAMQQLCSELVLIDVNKEKALGEALDISHGLPFIGDMYIHAGDYSDVKDADCIIITAGIPRKEGETRLDLAKKNDSGFRSRCVHLQIGIVRGNYPVCTFGVQFM